MAINLNGFGPNQTGTNGARDRDGAAGVSRSNGAPVQKQSESTEQKSDSVRLSDQVQSLQSLEASVREMPEVDTERVDRIKSALANGEYEINYDRLAAAIQRFEDDL